MQDIQPFTIMTVCTGNICRSPMAQIVLQDFVEQRGLTDQVRVLSSGVSSEEHGNPIDPRARKVLVEHGFSLPGYHFAHKITRDEIAQTDLFLPMTASHMQALLRQLPAQKCEAVHMYRSFMPQFAHYQGRQSDMDLADPWYGGPHEFEVAITQIEQAAPYIMDWVSQQLQ